MPYQRFKLKIWILFGIWILLFGVSSTDAARIDDLRSDIKSREEQIKAIEAEIAEYQKQIDEKVSEAKTLKNEISRLEAIVKKLNAEIRLTEGKIRSSELNLERLRLEIGNKNEEIREQKDSLAEVIRNVYTAENESLMEILLKNGAISDFFGDIARTKNLEEAIRGDLEVLKELKKDLEGREAEESLIKKSLQNFAAELADRRSIEVSARKNKDQLLKVTKNQEAEYQKLLREREKQRALIQDEIRKVEDELRLLIDTSSLPAARRGVLGWPLTNVKIAQRFGMTTFAMNTDVYGGKGHNGIDLDAAVGTNIMSAEDGVVKSIGNSDLVCPGGSYGKWVLVEHTNNLATLYAHLSYSKVDIGQKVKRGEVIAYTGNTGYTTGPHLHFTVYDARTVHIKPSRICGLLPYGGYMDPLIYL